MSLALANLGVPTPSVIAYVLYPPGGVIQRADVCTLELSGSADLAKILMRDPEPARSSALGATAILVATLSHAGVRHHDLNAKNVLLFNGKAYVLDVDRVVLNTSAESALAANLARIARSLRKWREKLGARISEQDVERVEREAHQVFASLAAPAVR